MCTGYLRSSASASGVNERRKQRGPDGDVLNEFIHKPEWGARM